MVMLFIAQKDRPTAAPTQTTVCAVRGEDDRDHHGRCGRINKRLQSRTACVIFRSWLYAAKRLQESMSQRVGVVDPDEVAACQREMVVEVQ
jgi:hypothetical protein